MRRKGMRFPNGIPRVEVLAEPSDLRDRIAEVIQENLVWEAPNMSARLADAVIAELGLRQETDYGTTYPNVPVTDRRFTRYVTEWKADDE